MTDPVIKLTFQANTAQIGQADQALAGLNRTATVGAREFAAFNKEASLSAREFAAFNRQAEVGAREFAAFNKQLQTHVTTTAHYRNANQDAANSLVYLTRAGQDAVQGGLYAVANNVEQITLALSNLASGGAAAGMAALKSSLLGPAGIVVGLTALTMIGPKIVSAISGFIDSLDTDKVTSFEQRVKEMKDRVEEAALSFDQLQAKSRAAFAGDAEQESGRRVGDFLRNSGAARAGRANLIEQETNAALNADPNVQNIRGDIGQLQGEINAAERAVSEARTPQEREAANIRLRRVRADNQAKILKLQGLIGGAQAAAQKTATTEVDRRLTAPTAADQETLAAQFQGMGMGDAAAGIRSRGTATVVAERNADALKDAGKKLWEGFQKASGEGAQRIGRRDRAAEAAAQAAAEADNAAGDRWFAEQMAPFEARAAAVARRNSRRQAGTQAERDAIERQRLLLERDQLGAGAGDALQKTNALFMQAAGNQAQQLAIMQDYQLQMREMQIRMAENDRKLRALGGANAQFRRTNQLRGR
jgi:hypothetical protein